MCYRERERLLEVAGLRALTLLWVLAAELYRFSR